jgi:hypothetical protein
MHCHDTKGSIGHGKLNTWKRRLGAFLEKQHFCSFFKQMFFFGVPEICHKDGCTPNVSKIRIKISCTGRPIAQYIH